MTGDCRLGLSIADWRLPIDIDDWDVVTVGGANETAKRGPSIANDINRQSSIPINNRQSPMTSIGNPQSQSTIVNRQ
jgi:hypothetical protein